MSPVEEIMFLFNVEQIYKHFLLELRSSRQIIGKTRCGGFYFLVHKAIIDFWQRLELKRNELRRINEKQLLPYEPTDQNMGLKDPLLRITVRFTNESDVRELSYPNHVSQIREREREGETVKRDYVWVGDQEIV